MHATDVTITRKYGFYIAYVISVRGIHEPTIRCPAAIHPC